ncbi:hypothetical protein BFJ63_vAg17502 [Fusarium oxysporum f. sp. narcissi]|uniref:Uncharacterized protein n=1 Tax=Fusarium oxysporum f. sp. narcissi TaxID=451672 RepID=A0A4Q2UZN5_FUSOX|nr:hypothetical protein BFJ63_vAg17502 [Fusarium oxysporum f. sp. narcissi]
MQILKAIYFLCGLALSVECNRSEWSDGRERQAAFNDKIMHPTAALFSRSNPEEDSPVHVKFNFQIGNISGSGTIGLEHVDLATPLRWEEPSSWFTTPSVSKNSTNWNSTCTISHGVDTKATGIANTSRISNITQFPTPVSFASPTAFNTVTNDAGSIRIREILYLALGQVAILAFI